MKINKHIKILFALTFILLIGCEDELLNKVNPNEPSTESFYKTEEDAIQAINATYSALQMFGVFNRYWIYTNSARSDESVFTDKQPGLWQVNGLDDFTMVGSLVAVKETWRDNYRGILKANMVLENVPAIEMDESLKNRILGEAYFLRALYHFNLIRNFSEKIPMYTAVPTATEDFFPHPAEEGEIYALIEADLIKAKGLLPIVDDLRGTPDEGRATRGAATTLLGKAYLFQEKYTEAAVELYEVIDGSHGAYDLVSNYRENNDDSNENNIESIFEVQYEISSDLSKLVWNIEYENQSASEANIIEQESTMIDGTGGMWWNQKPGPEMIAEYEVSPTTGQVIDPRYYESIWCKGGYEYEELLLRTPENGGDTLIKAFYEDYISASRKGEVGWRKWGRDFETSGYEAGSPINVRVLRLADVYLMYTECIVELPASKVGGEDPVYFIDLIRDRARNTPGASQFPQYSYDTVVNKINSAPEFTLPTVAELMSQAPTHNGRTLNNLRDIVRHERMIELAYEGKRWDDIVRWGIGENLFGGIYKPWLPIYTTDLFANPNLLPNSSN